jgi:outer membrane protein OmpA-like peptidoglycan-associated protein
MKHLSRLLLASLLFLSFSTVNAQDEDNPWAIGVGVNVVDLYPTGEDAPRGDYFSQFFETDHWNVLPSISKVSVARYIGAGFSAEIAGSVNRIDQIGEVGVDGQELMYYGADLSVNYSFRELINEEGWFDPYLGVGGSYVWLEDKNFTTANGNLGFNFWFSDNIAFFVQTTYKHAFDDVADGGDAEGYKHFQHSAGIKIGFGGSDSDGDGVYDKDDDCPETAGLKEFNGCPDSDGDGIPDKEDDCPNTAGPAEYNGCPDSDGDGVVDNEDDCPDTAGEMSLQGCPDSDGDGIKDGMDDCPNESGPEANNGCPWPDSDGDGVLDKDDQCPEASGSEANNGCPEVTVEVIKELNEYSKSILFDLGKATIRDKSNDELKSIAGIMKEYPETTFHIEGHTDRSGSAKFNQKLSEKRAASVRDYLSNNGGISNDRITSKGYGEADPIATNKTAAGRQKNRRVEVSLEKNRDDKNKEDKM